MRGWKSALEGNSNRHFLQCDTQSPFEKAFGLVRSRLGLAWLCCAALATLVSARAETAPQPDLALAQAASKKEFQQKITPFLNALGRGESALLKRSTGFPRYGGLEEVLTPPQMGAVGKVASEMERDVAMSNLATQGNPALTKLLNQDTAPFKLPSYLSWVASTLNAVSNKLQGRVSESTLKMIAKGMETGKGANDLLNAIPASERNAVTKAMIDSKAWNPAVLATIGTESGNALAPKRPKQNALAE